MVAIGAVREALDSFLESKMWEKAILCYQILNETQAALDLVYERLKYSPSPRLYCILGDLKNDPSYYHTAWKHSNMKYSRAAESLGSYSYKNEQYQDAIIHFKNVLALNPIDTKVWFTLACSLVRLHHWIPATDAFKRFLSLSPEDPSAWCNLSTCYIQLNKPHEALNCLIEALKYKHDNLSMWENYIILSVSLKNIPNTIFGLNKFIQLSSSLSPQITKILKNLIDFTSTSDPVTAANNAITTDDRSLNNKIYPIIQNILDKFGHSFDALIIAFDYFSVHSMYEKAFEIFFKAYRLSIRDPNINTSLETFEKYAEAVISVVQLYLSLKNDEDLNKGVHLEGAYLNDLFPKLQSATDSFINLTKSSHFNTSIHKSLVRHVQQIHANRVIYSSPLSY